MNKKITNKQDTVWNIAQIGAGILVTFWFLSWFMGFINLQNYKWYIALLIIIAIITLVLVFKIKSLLRVLWALVLVLAVAVLTVMYALKDLRIQF
ncbi:hypothetical protein CR983_03315 [Candidatus Saccharibacteria bacterium]|nr:MAG: hypothetical protein CR983_03315 [Candidatus Saccharibacteria bacterium]